MSVLPEQPSDDAERRVAPRARTLKRAKILFNNNYSTFDCVVRNISATGALLTIDPSVHLPRTFDIRIGDDPHARPAKLVYRRELFAGIHFLDTDAGGEDVAAFYAKPPTPAAAVEPPAPAAEPGEAVEIRRIVPDALPNALVRLFAWS